MLAFVKHIATITATTIVLLMVIILSYCHTTVIRLPMRTGQFLRESLHNVIGPHLVSLTAVYSRQGGRVHWIDAPPKLSMLHRSHHDTPASRTRAVEAVHRWPSRGR
jgi:hypothetical protein